MGRVSWACCSIILLLAPVPGLAQAVTNACRLVEAASLDVVVPPSGLLLVPITVDDRPTYFLLDTGAPVSLIGAGLAASLNLPLKHSGRDLMFAADGRGLRDWTEAHSLQLGLMKRGATQFVVAPDTSMRDPTEGGMLGADFLQFWDLELNLAAHKVGLFDQSHCPDNVVYWAKEYTEAPITVAPSGHLFLQVKLDGKPLEATLDTGSNRSILPLDVAQREFGLMPGSPDMAAAGELGTADGETVTAYQYRFKTLEVAGITFQNPRILLAPTKKQAEGQSHRFNALEHEEDMRSALILGIEQLRLLHLYIAYKEQKLYVTPAGVHD